MAQALLVLGGNLGDVRTTLGRAVTALCDGREVKLVARSSDYRTPPWGVPDQPPFINLAIVVETALTPRALLDHALRVEAMFGRDRTKERRWGPRILDIDIIACYALEIEEDRRGVENDRGRDKARLSIDGRGDEVHPRRDYPWLSRRTHAVRTG